MRKTSLLSGLVVFCILFGRHARAIENSGVAISYRAKSDLH